MTAQVDEKSGEITTVKYGLVTSVCVFSRKNRGLLIRERFAAQTLRQNGSFIALFHAPVASQIFQRPDKNRLVLACLTAAGWHVQDVAWACTRRHSVNWPMQF